MIVVYYLGGPWDLHKVALQKAPGDREIIRGIERKYRAIASDPIEYVDHTYHVRPIARGVFVAMSEDMV